MMAVVHDPLSPTHPAHNMPYRRAPVAVRQSDDQYGGSTLGMTNTGMYGDDENPLAARRRNMAAAQRMCEAAGLVEAGPALPS